MKIPFGVTVYHGGKKFVKEIPDEMAKIAGYTEPVAATTTNKKPAKEKPRDGQSQGSS